MNKINKSGKMSSPATKQGNKHVIDVKQSDDENSDHENEITTKKDPKIKDQPEKEKSTEDDDICELEHLRKLFVGGLPPYTTEEDLKTFYGEWGTVVDVIVMRDPASKRSRGFGFITYTKAAMVNKAQENRPHIIDGKTVEAKRALPRPEREARETNITVKKLFVGGLKDNHDEDCLQEYFSQFGNVISVKILTDKTTGKRRGFAFIEYDDYDSVDKAILQKTHSIKFVDVDVKKSIYKQDPPNKDRQSSDSSSGKSSQIEKAKPNIQKSRYRPPPISQPPSQPMQPNYQQPPPPPPNYNYWGQQPPAMPYGYQQPQPQPPMNNWSYPPAPNAWNAGPPPPAPSAPMPNSWYPQQQPWGPPPTAAHPPQPHPPQPHPPQVHPPQVHPPQSHPPQSHPSQAHPPQTHPPQGHPPQAHPSQAHPPQIQPPQPQPPQPQPPQSHPPPPHAPQPHQPMAIPPGAVPPPPNWSASVMPSAPPAVPPPQQQQQRPPNFGTGYQQNYGGGPAKHNANANRMNPYSVPPSNAYGNQPPANAYGNYPGPPNNPNVSAGNDPRPMRNPMQNGPPVAPPVSTNGRYRR